MSKTLEGLWIIQATHQGRYGCHDYKSKYRVATTKKGMKRAVMAAKKGFTVEVEVIEYEVKEISRKVFKP